MLVKNLFIVVLISPIFLLAQEVRNLSNPRDLTPLKAFSPPPIIAPNMALSYGVENQFDRTPRDSYYSVIDTLNNAFNPLHMAGGIYQGSTYDTVLFRARETHIYGLANFHYTQANSYKDGSGNRVEFGYRRYGGAVVLGVLPNSYNEIRLSLIYDEIDDDKQPHYMMDPSLTQRYVTRVNYRLGYEDFSNTLSLEGFYRNLHREADNFSNRSNNGARMQMKMDRDIVDLTLKYDVDFSEFHNQVGVIYTYDTHTGKRFAKQPNMSDFIFNGYRFPHVVQNQVSIFENISYELSPNHKLQFSMNYDYNHASVKDYNSIVGVNGTQIITPSNIWFNHYGRFFSGSIHKDALSAALKYDFLPSEQQNYSLKLASIERIGDNNERFVALNPPGTQAAQLMQGWASNPFLKPERRNQIKAEVNFKQEAYMDYMQSRFDENALNFRAFALADFAKDFIIYDRSRGQEGVLANLGTVITRNVDARLYSLGGELSYNFLENFGTKAKVYYNYGQNITDNRPLYQIAPLEANFNFDYHNIASFGRYNLGAALRVVAHQNRRDDNINTGLGIDRDVRGFGIVDLYAGVAFSDSVGLRFGVDNLFGKYYAEYISGYHVEAIAPTNVIYAPGRRFYVSIFGNF